MSSNQQTRAPRRRTPSRLATTRARVWRWEGDRRDHLDDDVTVEEPCEIRLDGEPVAVVMRTPGHDRELAAGFLYTEGILRPADLGAVSHCAEPDALNPENIVDVRLAAGRRPRRDVKRHFFATSSCGVCGKASIEEVRVEAPPLPDGAALARHLLPALAVRLGRQQPVFAATGGLHAAAVFTMDGELLVLREDIGRHNAVDKVIGHALLADRLPLDSHVLVVSGRTSFEIVQKALLARLPVVAGVSAASSLAVDLARDSNMTLIGFLRGRRMNVYAGEGRITS